MMVGSPKPGFLVGIIVAQGVRLPVVVNEGGK